MVHGRPVPRLSLRGAACTVGLGDTRTHTHTDSMITEMIYQLLHFVNIVTHLDDDDLDSKSSNIVLF